jgi:hypothetical protein
LRVKEQWRRLIEQDFFSFSYFLAFIFNKETAKKLLTIFSFLSILLGTVLALKLLYSYWSYGGTKGFWGGMFVVGNLLSFSIFSTFYLFLKQKNIFIKGFLFLIGTLLLAAFFIPDRRSLELGLLVGLATFLIGLYKLDYINKIIKTFIVLFSIVITIGGAIFFFHSERAHFYIYLIKTYGLTEYTLNKISTNRILIAKSACSLIEEAWRKGDYIKLLIGWGYGPQKQYKNIPGKWRQEKYNEYESFLPITVFINGGLINLIFIVWFYISAIILTRKVVKNLTQPYGLLMLTFISAVWVNLIYHLFTLFWVPINSIYYLILGLLEKLTKEEGKLI